MVGQTYSRSAWESKVGRLLEFKSWDHWDNTGRPSLKNIKRKKNTLTHLIVDHKTLIPERVLPHSWEEGILLRQARRQALLVFPHGIKSYPFYPITFLRGWPCFSHAYKMKSPSKPKGQGSENFWTVEHMGAPHSLSHLILCISSFISFLTSFIINQ